MAKYEPGLERAKQHISVFAIKRDGLMNRSGWAALGPYATVPFSEPCDVGYSDAMFSAVPDVADAVDDYIRENGVTDEILDQIAPAAKGDLIMILTVTGHPLAKPEKSEASSYSSSPSGRGGRRGRRSSSTSSRAEESSSSNGETFEATAAFFSVHEHHAVASATLRSSGPDTDKALTQFTTRLEHEFPGSTCRGWDWSVHLDGTRIKKLSEP